MTFVVSSDLWRRWWVCWRIEGIWSGPKMGCNTALANSLTPAYPQHTNTQTRKHTICKHTNTQYANTQTCTHKYTTIKSWAAAWHWSQSDTILFSTHKNTNTCQHKNTHTDKRNTWKQKNTQTQKDLLQSGLGHPPDPSLPSTLPRSCTSGKTIFTRVFHPAQNFFHQILNFFTQVKTISTRAQKYFHQSSEIVSPRSKLLFKFGLNPFYPKTTHDLLPTMGFGAWSFLVWNESFLWSSSKICNITISHVVHFSDFFLKQSWKVFLDILVKSFFFCIVPLQSSDDRFVTILTLKSLQGSGSGIDLTVWRRPDPRPWSFNCFLYPISIVTFGLCKEGWPLVLKTFKKVEIMLFIL